MQQIDSAQHIPSETVDHASKSDASAKSGGTKGEKVRAMLRARLGEEIYKSWFASMDFEAFDGRVVRATVPVKFLKNWIQSHYSDDLLECCGEEFSGVERVDVTLRQPGFSNGRASAVTTGVAPPRSKAMPGSEPAVVEARPIISAAPGGCTEIGRAHV